MESGLPVTFSPSTGSPSPQTHPSLAARQRESRKTTPATPAFLSNLGKATLRGIRKCPQCGIYNGTRGLSCKNKACGIVFKDGGCAVVGRGAKRGAMEVVRVVIDGGGGGREEEEGEDDEESETGGGGSNGVAQVFSVCQRGRGAGSTQRGFVELVPTDTAIATGDGATLLTRVNLGRCFLPACRQGQRTNQSQTRHAASHTPKQGSSCDSPCAHIKQAMECQRRATPLPLKSSVLEALPASSDVQDELWRLATESPGPLVQRASRDTMVVKCLPGSAHPLGLLHLTVGPGGLLGALKGQAVFQCACQGGCPRGGPGAGGRSEDGNGGSPASPQHCLHFYACMCAFASDDKLAAEFGSFLDYSSNGLKMEGDCGVLCSSDKPLLQPEPITAGQPHKAKRPRQEEPITAPSVVCPVGVGREGGLPPPLRRPGQRRAPAASLLKTPGSSQLVDERQVSQGFQQWLASVTERIHQTMHYQCDGRPEPLVFHIPQAFFNALQQRLSLGSKKRRLPNATTVFERKDSVGSFSKYTWHLTNLTQVKRIFDTPELPLELTQSFVRNMDGSYSPFRCPELPPDPPDGYSRTERPPQPIRPLELRTFFKVGAFSADQNEVTPFVMEWIPDVLPRCGVGELRISFQYGHQQGGQPDYCEGGDARPTGPAAAERAARNKTPSDSSQPNHSSSPLLQVVV